jgi:hypothetical protein
MAREQYPNLIDELAIVQGETYKKLTLANIISFPGDVTTAELRGHIKTTYREQSGVLLAEFFFQPSVYNEDDDVTYIYPYLTEEQTFSLPGTFKYQSGREPNVKVNHIYDIEVILDDEVIKYSPGFVQVIGEITGKELPPTYPDPGVFLRTTDIGTTVQPYDEHTVIDPDYVQTEENYTTVEKNKLADIEPGAEVNVNADWNAVDGDAFIENKPNLGSAAFTDSADYATAEQGEIAESALQPEDIGDTVQPYNEHTVIDANYVQTEENYTTLDKDKLNSLYYLPVPIVSADYTAINHTAVPCDSSNNPFSITLPLGGDSLLIVDVIGIELDSGFGANPVTVLPNAGETIMGDSELILDAGGTKLILKRIDNDWRIYDFSIPALPPSVEWGEILNRPNTPNWKHLWDNSVEYLKNDVVEHNGSTYIAVNINTNSEPLSADWELFVEKGNTGDQGIQGIQGIQGVSGTYIGETPPENTDLLWIDTSEGLGYNTITTTGIGTIIDFVNPKIFNSAISPGTTNITNDLINAQIGVVQKIYHQNSAEPTYPANWVKLGDVEYASNELNIIYAEWCSNDRIEYWMVHNG